MGKKMSRLDFASISSRLGFTFILYNIKNWVPILCGGWSCFHCFPLLQSWLVPWCCVTILGLKHLVSAIYAPFLGIIMMRSFGGTIRWNFVRLAFLVGAVIILSVIWDLLLFSLVLRFRLVTSAPFLGIITMRKLVCITLVGKCLSGCPRCWGGANLCARLVVGKC